MSRTTDERDQGDPESTGYETELGYWVIFFTPVDSNKIGGIEFRDSQHESGDPDLASVYCWGEHLTHRGTKEIVEILLASLDQKKLEEEGKAQ